MKNKSYLMLLFASFLFAMTSCQSNSKKENEVAYHCPMSCEGDKTYDTAGQCPVCGMNTVADDKSEKELADDRIDPSSIFNLTSKWNTQDGQAITLASLKGEVLVMVMIYTSCESACPRLVADMRSIYQKVDDASIKYVMVSIDPRTDTPDRLKAFAKENQMDNDQFVFLQGGVDDVREFSNVLAVKYKKISPMDFSHSNIISVFDQRGVLYHQQEGLGVDNELTVSKIKELVIQ